jgi:hypothetical protein
MAHDLKLDRRQSASFEQATPPKLTRVDAGQFRLAPVSAAQALDLPIMGTFKLAAMSLPVSELD